MSGIRNHAIFQEIGMEENRYFSVLILFFT